MYISCFIILPWSLIWIHPCLIRIQHPLMMMMMMMIMMIIIVIIIILLVVQLLSLLLLPSSSSSFFCVSECFLTGVWLFDIHFVSLGKPFIRSLPSNRPAVLLSFFLYFVNFHSILSPFFIRFLLRSVAVRRVRSNKIKWYYLATKYTSKIVTNIFAHVIKRRGQIKKELFFIGSVWENICVNTDISIKWQ